MECKFKTASAKPIFFKDVAAGAVIINEYGLECKPEAYLKLSTPQFWNCVHLKTGNLDHMDNTCKVYLFDVDCTLTLNGAEFKKS